MSGAPVTAEQKAKVIDAVGKGVHPPVACTAAGLNVDYFYLLRSRARRGDAKAQEFLSAIMTAQAQSEIVDVEATFRATQPIEEKSIICPHCDCEYTAEPEQLAALAMRVLDAQKAKASAAEVALKKLERRHPSRWSQKVVHTIAEEHDGLLDVAQEVLEPEAFELLCEAYLARREGAGETPSSPSGQAPGDVH